MKKSKLILIVLTALLTALTACGKKAGTVDAHTDWQSQYDLGVHYLSELDYEKAIAAFNAAIDIDPKRTDAYLMLADVYLTMGEPQKAANVLALGLEAASEPDRITEKLKEIKKQYPDTKIPSLDNGNTDPESSSNAGSTVGSDPYSDPVITAMEESIAAQFDFAAPFYEGFARVGRQTGDDNMKYFFINEAGEVISNEYDVALDFYEGVAIVGNYPPSEDSRYSDYLFYGYIDTTGKEIIPLTWFGDQGGVRPYYFYDGLAEVTWYGENYEIYTNLIDMTGAKQLPVDIICEDNRGYGGGDEDPRLLYLTESREYAANTWRLYSMWNPVQGMRVRGTGSWPMTVSDGENTLQLNENWEIISSKPGYREDLGIYSGLDGIYMLYTSYFDREIGTLIDAAENVLAENVRYAYTGLGDRMIVTFPDITSDRSYGSVYALYSRDGERLSEDYVGLSTWASGYILQQERGENWNDNVTFIVTDADLNELFTVQAYSLSQSGGWFGSEDTAPLLFSRSYYAGESSQSLTEYLDTAGQVVFPYEPDTELNILTSDYVIRQRSDGAEIYTIDGHSVSFMPGIRDLRRAWTWGESENLPLYVYRTIENVQNGIYDYTYAQMNEENGTFSFTEVAYNPNTGTISEASDPSGKAILLKNDYCALWGFMDYNALWGFNDYRMPPVTLKIGSEEIAESAALSLIGNNLYKQGATIDENPEDYWLPVAVDISLHTVDGSWQSDVYEDMGYLSYNHISFRKNGKWGYLRVVQ